LTCPDCQTTYLHFIKKRTDNAILNEDMIEAYVFVNKIYEVKAYESLI